MSDQYIDAIEVLTIPLTQISKVYAYKLVNNEQWVEKSNGEKIHLLYRLGYSNKDISDIIGTTINTVRKEISNRKEK